MSAEKPKSPYGPSQDIQWHSRTTSGVVAQNNNTPSRPGAAASSDHNEADTSDNSTGKEIVAVFNANTPDGSSVVRALSASGASVVAIVRVFTSKNTRALLQIPNVTVKVADVLDAAAVHKALHGVHRAVLCLTHWEKFESKHDAEQAELILAACIKNKVPHLVFSTFEDTKFLREKGLKSQIIPDAEGRIRPKFKAMKGLKRMARENRVQLTHLITSYLDQEKSKKSLCLIVGENGKLIVQPHMMGV
ncbi:NmrA-like family [Fragilaria crotonensis]|nr:NmrA-like family [Fragilaria crotonensis]